MLSAIEDKALILDAKVRGFRLQQTQLDGTVTAEDKVLLRKQFRELEGELNHYLSGQYAIKKDGLKKWSVAYKPFHWFCDFHAIMHEGGFDVVIGNPPWKEYAAVKKDYQVHGYITESCGNLHGITTERAMGLVRDTGRISFIVQLPMVSSSRMTTVRSLLQSSSAFVSAASFDDRPGKLFEGMQNCRSVIFSAKKGSSGARPTCTRYQRWPTAARSNLFSLLEYQMATRQRVFPDQFEKAGSILAAGIVEKLDAVDRIALGTAFSKQNTEHFVFYQEATRYWVKATVGLPYYAKNGLVSAPAHGRYIYTPTARAAHIVNAVMQSSLFYLYFVLFSDCFHLSDNITANFPLPRTVLNDERLIDLNSQLIKDLKKNAIRKTIVTKDQDTIEYAEFFAGASKAMVDKIDHILAEHYGFTTEERDFVVNYDIQFRLSSDANEE